MSAGPMRRVSRLRLNPLGRLHSADDVAVEEPLEVRVAGRPVVVLMRTPGQDEELAVGHLLAEGVIATAHDVDAVLPCPAAPATAVGNIVDVTLMPGARVDFSRHGTARYSTSACGVCGTAALDLLRQRLGPLTDPRPLPTSWLLAAPTLMRKGQALFSATGGVHAAGLLDETGAVTVIREDVGRHNAADKALGSWALSGQPPPLAMVVSSRAGFELVEKAWALKVPALVSVGAPTSMALDAARESGITLAAFVREDSCSVYTHPDRLTG